MKTALSKSEFPTLSHLDEILGGNRLVQNEKVKWGVTLLYTVHFVQ